MIVAVYFQFLKIASIASIHWGDLFSELVINCSFHCVHSQFTLTWYVQFIIFFNILDEMQEICEGLQFYWKAAILFLHRIRYGTYMVWGRINPFHYTLWWWAQGVCKLYIRYQKDSASFQVNLWTNQTQDRHQAWLMNTGIRDTVGVIRSPIWRLSSYVLLFAFCHQVTANLYSPHGCHGLPLHHNTGIPCGSHIQILSRVDPLLLPRSGSSGHPALDPQ